MRDIDMGFKIFFNGTYKTKKEIVMKPHLSATVSLMGVLLLTTACGSLGVGPVVKQVKEGPPPANNYKELVDMELPTQDYSKWLQKDYKVLTLFEYDEMFDYDSAEHFGLKSLAAGEGTILKPDAVSSRVIDPRYQTEAQAMYGYIENAYARAKNASMPKEMARLQTSYDCWLEQIEEDIQPNHIMKCREMFYDAWEKLKDLPPPVIEVKTVPATVVLYFETDSSIIAESESRKLEAAVMDQGISHTEITIEGYADTVDTSDYNINLSKRRAEAVMDAIRAFDPGLTNVYIKALGETNLAVPTPDKTAEPENRRVVIHFN
jgi:OOP family OmpA-OmpF porin